MLTSIDEKVHRFEMESLRSLTTFIIMYESIPFRFMPRHQMTS